MPTSSRSPSLGCVRVREPAVLGLAWLVGIALALVSTPVSRAQETPKATPAPAPAPAPAPTPTPAPAPAPASGPAATSGADAQGAPEAGPTPEEEAPQVKQESLLHWAIRASGPIGLFLLCLSVYFTAIVIRLFLEFRLKEAVPPALVERLDAAIRERRFQEAYDACRDDNSFLARLVRTGVANLPNGRAEAKEAMNTMSEEIIIGMEQRISYLATIGTLGPMIGLVGTIWGMIMSFQTIATAAGSQPKANEVAEGISTALFITLEGVSLAVPAIFFFALFRNRIAQLAMEANKVADRTIAAFWTAAKQPQGAKPQAPASV
ncbi:MAG TPA: MotA/TolQ/ExbB proton channel family protein [Isosphaeraceae bacterium]|jgi:biopolymer transport protein ExbB